MKPALPFWFSGDESFVDWLDQSKGIAPPFQGDRVVHVRGPFVVTSTNKDTNDFLKDAFVLSDLFLGSYGDSQKAVVMSSNIKLHVFDVKGRLSSENKKLTFESVNNGTITIRPVSREDLPVMRKLAGENFRSLKAAMRSFWSQG